MGNSGAFGTGNTDLVGEERVKIGDEASNRAGAYITRYKSSNSNAGAILHEYYDLYVSVNEGALIPLKECKADDKLKAAFPEKAYYFDISSVSSLGNVKLVATSSEVVNGNVVTAGRTVTVNVNIDTSEIITIDDNTVDYKLQQNLQAWLNQGTLGQKKLVDGFAFILPEETSLIKIDSNGDHRIYHNGVAVGQLYIAKSSNPSEPISQVRNNSWGDSTMYKISELKDAGRIIEGDTITSDYPNRYCFIVDDSKLEKDNTEYSIFFAPGYLDKGLTLKDGRKFEIMKFPFKRDENTTTYGFPEPFGANIKKWLDVNVNGGIQVTEDMAENSMRAYLKTPDKLVYNITYDTNMFESNKNRIIKTDSRGYSDETSSAWCDIYLVEAPTDGSVITRDYLKTATCISKLNSSDGTLIKDGARGDRRYLSVGLTSGKYILVAAYQGYDKAKETGSFVWSEWTFDESNIININDLDLTDTSGNDPEEKPGFLEKLVAGLVMSVGKMVKDGDKGLLGWIPSIEEMIYNESSSTSIDFFGSLGRELDNDSPVLEMRKVVTQWYTIFRNVAICFYLLMLILTGIKIGLTSLAAEKSKYKELLKNWITGLLLLLVFHYVMNGIIIVSNEMVQIMNPNASATDEMESLEVSFKEKGGEGRLVQALIFCYIIGLNVLFFIIYLKRVLIIGFLIMIYPLVCISYVVDKVGDGKAQAFNKWFKEFTVNVVVQLFHAIIWVLICTTALKVATTGNNFLFAIVAITFLLPAEAIIRSMFGIEASTAKSIGSAIATVAAVKGVASAGKSIASKTLGKEGIYGAIKERSDNNKAQAKLNQSKANTDNTYANTQLELLKTKKEAGIPITAAEKAELATLSLNSEQKKLADKILDSSMPTLAKPGTPDFIGPPPPPARPGTPDFIGPPVPPAKPGASDFIGPPIPPAKPSASDFIESSVLPVTPGVASGSGIDKLTEALNKNTSALEKSEQRIISGATGIVKTADAKVNPDGLEKPKGELDFATTNKIQQLQAKADRLDAQRDTQAESQKELDEKKKQSRYKLYKAGGKALGMIAAAGPALGLGAMYSGAFENGTDTMGASYAAQLADKTSDIPNKAIGSMHNLYESNKKAAEYNANAEAKIKQTIEVEREIIYEYDPEYTSTLDKAAIDKALLGKKTLDDLKSDTESVELKNTREIKASITDEWIVNRKNVKTDIKDMNSKLTPDIPEIEGKHEVHEQDVIDKFEVNINSKGSVEISRNNVTKTSKIESKVEEITIDDSSRKPSRLDAPEKPTKSGKPTKPTISDKK